MHPHQIGLVIAFTLCALGSFVVTTLALSGKNLKDLYVSANLAHYQAMTSTDTNPHRYFVLSDNPVELREFAEREVLVSLVTHSDLTSTTTLELAASDAATLERLRDLPSTGLVLNASSALLCR